MMESLVAPVEGCIDKRTESLYFCLTALAKAWIPDVSKLKPMIDSSAQVRGRELRLTSPRAIICWAMYSIPRLYLVLLRSSPTGYTVWRSVSRNLMYPLYVKQTSSLWLTAFQSQSGRLKVFSSARRKFDAFATYVISSSCSGSGIDTRSRSREKEMCLYPRAEARALSVSP